MKHWFYRVLIKGRRRSVVRATLLGLASLLALIVLPAHASITATDDGLKAYKANYKTRFAGFTFTTERSLQKNDEGDCVLSNRASILFLGFKEQAVFACSGAEVHPYRYDYTNTVKARKNVSMVYDWGQNKVLTTKGDKSYTVPLPADGVDALSLQAQVRLDVKANPDNFTQKTYAVVTAKRVKHFVVENLGEQTIGTPAGTFNAIKLRQSSADDEDETLLWLAKDHDYFLVRVENSDADGKRRIAQLKDLPRGF